jgi:hypothetical protein
MTDNPGEQHLQFVRDLIAARCPELSDEEITTPTEPESGAVWGEVMENILDALIEVENRLDGIEASISDGQGDDDGADDEADTTIQ